jgi:hypothetical protein
MKKIAFFTFLSLILFISPVFAQDYNCIVYFTGVGCPNCKITDPVILEEIPERYPNLIIIEYELYETSENGLVMSQYVSNYNLYPGVPQIVFNKSKNLVGRNQVLDLENSLRAMNNNSCPMIDGSSVDFNNLDITSLPGKPNIWRKNSILISSNQDTNNEILKQILTSENLTVALDGTKFEITTPQEVSLSGKSVKFDNSINIDEWIFQWQGEEIIENDQITTTTTIENITETGQETIKLPVLGEIDISKMGLLSLSIFIGILDGFNACAMWALCFLLTFLVASGSRKRIFLIGGTFIFVSGLVYFLFISAWLNVFLILGYMDIIRIIISVFAVVFGLVCIKDFFAFGEGISFIIPKKKRDEIVKKMKSVTDPKKTLTATILGVAVLAAGVNLVELLCTTGFPAVYTRILASHELPTLSYYFYLIVYITFYMLDDLLIFSVIILTLGAKKFPDKYKRLSKLISGLVILALGLIMLFRPELLMFG